MQVSSAPECRPPARPGWNRLLAAVLALALALAAGCATAPRKKAGRAAKPKPTPAMRMAIRHYNMGIDAYTNSRYAEAIQHWRVTVEKDPSNPMAPEYIKRAEKMIQLTGQKPPPPPKPK